MKKILLTLAMIAIFVQNSAACDACGCALGGNYFGILPQFGKNFVGLRWSQAKFYAYMNHQSEYLPAESSNDTYTKLEVWGRYYVNKRIQLFAFLPYSFNNMEGTHQTIRANGLSDITIAANYLLVNTGEDLSKKFRQTLSVGTGVKLPTGEYDLHDKGTLVNQNFQMGTGSIDFSFSSIYTLRYNKFGSNVEAAYKVNTRNKNDYYFGNQFYAAYQFFYLQKVKSIAVLPNLGLHYEQAQQHKEGNVIKSNTGGNALLATAGLETYFSNFSVGMNYKHPVSQHYNSDSVADIESKDRILVSFTYNF